MTLILYLPSDQLLASALHPPPCTHITHRAGATGRAYASQRTAAKSRHLRSSAALAAERAEAAAAAARGALVGLKGSLDTSRKKISAEVELYRWGEGYAGGGGGEGGGGGGEGGGEGGVTALCMHAITLLMHTRVNTAEQCALSSLGVKV
jgi:hypothetical protein